MTEITFKQLGSYGRLGNQLWEVAALFGLANRYGAVPLLPPDWKYKDYFNIDNSFFADLETDIRVTEPRYEYIPDLLENYKNHKTVDILGTFQSWRYFDKIIPEIKKMLIPKSVKNYGKWSVSVHVRRGDYVGNKNYVQYDASWYKRVIKKHFKDERYVFYVVSDDEQYIRDSFSGDNYIIKHGSDVEDFIDIVSCHHHILSPSSFSWWGAFLSPYKGKTIRPPRIHTGKLSALDESDMWCPDWTVYNDIHITLLTFADDKYKDKQERLVNAAKVLNFDDIKAYTLEDLKKTEFYSYNNILFSEERGCGYWRWKPFYILETLKSIEDDDVVMYLDSGDMVFGNIRDFIERETKSSDIILTSGSNVQVEWTKMDCFVKMGCAKEKYFDAIQIEAGCIIVKKTDLSLQIIKEWFDYCMTNIITDSPSESNNNIGFKEHRHDQSILTNLATKYKIKKSSDIRNYIECNYEPFDEVYDLSDVTFIIPMRYDSPERKENLDIVLAYINKYFITNIIVGEQGSDGFFSYVEKDNVSYIDFDTVPNFYNPLFIGAFHRTRMLNFMTMMSKTEIIFNWDGDVLIEPRMVIDAVNRMRNGTNFCYPYQGIFARTTRDYIPKIKNLMDVACLRGIIFPGMEPDNQTRSFGGAVGFRKSAYFIIGLENENFVSHAPEDVDREHRMRMIGGGYERIAGPLYHLDHPIMENSHHGNEWMVFNNTEWRRVKNLDANGYRNYITTWKWIDEYKHQRFFYKPNN